MIEIKLSQGAKPGHGGILPAAKVTPEIAAHARRADGRDCISPARHTRLLDAARDDGLHRRAARALAAASRWASSCASAIPGSSWASSRRCWRRGVTPDFIVVDGAEGGTGAAPVEFSDHIGAPMREGLLFVHNVLVGAGMRDRIKIGVAGRIVSAFDIASVLAIGADWANAARGFMFALGCVQSARATPTAARPAWPPRTGCASARWWSRTRPSGSTISTA